MKPKPTCLLKAILFDMEKKKRIRKKRIREKAQVKIPLLEAIKQCSLDAKPSSLSLCACVNDSSCVCLFGFFGNNFFLLNSLFLFEMIAGFEGAVSSRLDFSNHPLFMPTIQVAPLETSILTPTGRISRLIKRF